MKIDLEGWKPFNVNIGQWYNIKERPRVMSVLATILGEKTTSAIAESVRKRYFSNPYESADWFNLDGEIALIAQEVLEESSS